jgi:hypothetical protein
MSDKIRNRFWARQADDLMTEISRQAANCKVKLLDPGVIEAIVQNNESICGTSNPLAFKKLREALMLGLVVREKAVDSMGAGQADAMVTAIRERLQESFGGQLGGRGGLGR